MRLSTRSARKVKNDEPILHQKLVENMSEAVCITDRRGRVVYANRVFCSIVGERLPKIIGKSETTFLDRASAQKNRALIKRQREKGLSSRYEAVLITTKGEKVPVLVNGTPLPDGGTMGIMTDMREIKTRESLYRQLVEHMNEGVWMLDERDRTVYVNPKYCEITGYSFKEMEGKTSYRLWDKATVRHIRWVNKHERQRGKSSSYEGMLITKSGKHIPMLISGTPVPGGGTMGILSDLTEVKSQQALYRNLVEQMSEIVWLLDDRGRTVYVNPKFYELTGYDPTEVLGKPGDRFFDSESAKRIRWVDTHERKRGIRSSYEATLVSKRGKKIPMLISGAPRSEGGTIGIMTDLTELKRKEMKERILNSAIGFANDAIIIVDATGRVESWNKGAKIIFGYKQEEILHRHLSKIFAKEDVQNLTQSQKVHYNYELRGKHKHRHLVIVSATVTPVFAEQNAPEAFCLLIARDVTAQSKYEEETALKYQKLRDAYNQFGIIRRQMDYLFELSELIATTTSLKLIGDFVVNAVIMLTRVDACSLRIHRSETSLLELVSSFGLDEEWKGNKLLPTKNSLAQKAFDRGTPLKVVDLLQEPAYHSKHLAKKSNFSSALVIPLIHHGALVGGLTLYVSPEKKLEIFENDFIEKFARIVAIGFANFTKAGLRKTASLPSLAGDDLQS